MTSETIFKLVSFVLAFTISIGLPESVGAREIPSTASENKLAPSLDIDLLQYMRTSITPIDEATIPRYSRNRDFGDWINTTPGESCFNTRYKVLARDADPSVPMVIEEKVPGFCRIASGLWHDPYTGEDRTESRTVQIDHVVALRNAYYSGAHAWRYARRCHYTNYIGNDFHLLPVDGRENELKLDYTPERYMPPNTKFHCRFLNIWMRTKAIWELKTTSSEVAAIERLAAANNCTSSDLRMPASELQTQRVISMQPSAACLKAEELKAQSGDVEPPPSENLNDPDFETEKATVH